MENRGPNSKLMNTEAEKSRKPELNLVEDTARTNDQSQDSSQAAAVYGSQFTSDDSHLNVDDYEHGDLPDLGNSVGGELSDNQRIPMTYKEPASLIGPSDQAGSSNVLGADQGMVSNTTSTQQQQFWEEMEGNAPVAHQGLMSSYHTIPHLTQGRSAGRLQSPSISSGGVDDSSVGFGDKNSSGLNAGTGVMQSSIAGLDTFPEHQSHRMTFEELKACFDEADDSVAESPTSNPYFDEMNKLIHTDTGNPLNDNADDQQGNSANNETAPELGGSVFTSTRSIHQPQLWKEMEDRGPNSKLMNTEAEKSRKPELSLVEDTARTNDQSQDSSQAAAIYGSQFTSDDNHQNVDYDIYDDLPVLSPVRDERLDNPGGNFGLGFQTDDYSGTFEDPSVMQGSYAKNKEPASLIGPSDQAGSSNLLGSDQGMVSNTTSTQQQQFWEEMEGNAPVAHQGLMSSYHTIPHLTQGRSAGRLQSPSISSGGVDDSSIGFANKNSSGLNAGTGVMHSSIGGLDTFPEYQCDQTTLDGSFVESPASNPHHDELNIMHTDTGSALNDNADDQQGNSAKNEAAPELGGSGQEGIQATAKTGRVANYIKPSIYKCMSLQIGKWKYEKSKSGDLMATFDYAAKTVEWELNGNDGYKRRMVIDWCDIAALKKDKTEPGRNPVCFLVIELKKDPKFYMQSLDKASWEEWDPEDIKEFTNGQAISRCREHILEARAASLEFAVNKMIKIDDKLSGLVLEVDTTVAKSFFLATPFKRKLDE